MARPRVVDGMPMLRARLNWRQAGPRWPDAPHALVWLAAGAALWMAVFGG